MKSCLSPTSRSSLWNPQAALATPQQPVLPAPGPQLGRPHSGPAGPSGVRPLGGEAPAAEQEGLSQLLEQRQLRTVSPALLALWGEDSSPPHAAGRNLSWVL